MSASPTSSSPTTHKDAQATTPPLCPAIDAQTMDVPTLLPMLMRAIEQKVKTIDTMKRLVQVFCASEATSDSMMVAGSMNQLAGAIVELLADVERDSQAQKDVVDQLQRTSVAAISPDIEDAAMKQQLSPAEGGSRTNILFIGNPGTGKSTLINCLLGQPVFSSGISYGGGLTNSFDERWHEGAYYMDTPGLADQVIEKKAAVAITSALRKGGRYKLFFFVRLEYGRVVSDDLVTIERVLDTINSDAKCNFSIIVNNVSSKQYAIMQQKGDEFMQVMALINSGKYITPSVIFNPRLPALIEQDDAIAPLPDEMHAFIRDAPCMDLEPQQVAEIDTSDYRALAERLRNDLELLRSNNAAKERKIRELQFARRDSTTYNAMYQRPTGRDVRYDVRMGVTDTVPLAVPVQPARVYDTQHELHQYDGYSNRSVTDQTRGAVMGTRTDRLTGRGHPDAAPAASRSRWNYFVGN